MKKRKIIYCILIMTFLCSCSHVRVDQNVKPDTVEKERYSKKEVKKQKGEQNTGTKGETLFKDKIEEGSAKQSCEGKKSIEEIITKAELLYQEEDRIYYCDGDRTIKCYDKRTEKVWKIFGFKEIHKDVKTIKIENGKLYVLYLNKKDVDFSEQASCTGIFELNMDGSGYREIYNAIDYTRTIKQMRDEKYRGSILENGKIYICYGDEIYMFNINDKTFKRAVWEESVYSFTVREDDIYFSEWSCDKFSIFKKNMITGELTVVLGDGKTKEGDKNEGWLYDCFEFIGEDMYVTVRKPNGIIKYKDGEQTWVIKDTGVVESLSEYDGKLYYLTYKEENDTNYIMEYNPETEELKEVINNVNLRTGFYIIEGYLFYMDNEVKEQCVRIDDMKK